MKTTDALEGWGEKGRGFRERGDAKNEENKRRVRWGKEKGKVVEKRQREPT